MTVPPYAGASLIMMTASYTSDRIQNRGFMVVLGCVLGAIGYMSVSHPTSSHCFLPPTPRILLGVTQIHIHVRYFATFCVAAGTYASLGLILAWCAYCHIYACVEGEGASLTHDSLFFSS